MDEKFYRFWSDIFRTAAEGEAKMDEIRRWMETGMRATEGFWQWFNKSFDPEINRPDGANFVAEFNRAARHFVPLFGMAPKSECLDLEEKVKALEQRVEEQEETIRRLRRLVADRDIGGSPEGTDQLAGLIAAQQRQLREWMKMFMPGMAGKETQGGR